MTAAQLDATALRSLQAPLKDRYRQDPAAASTALTATASFADPGLTCTVDGWAGATRAGLHRATGGDGSDACSGDMLLEALLACAGVTLRSVATSMGLDVSTATLRADAVFDARGTLGVSREAPVGVQGVRIEVTLETAADDPTLEKLARLTERYCVVGQSLAQPPAVVVRRAGSR